VSRPRPTHVYTPLPVQAIRYTGDNAEEVLAWCAVRHVPSRRAQYAQPGQEHPPVLVEITWGGGERAEGDVQPGEWLVYDLGTGAVSHYKHGTFVRRFQDEPPQRHR
jgi:hypothetical protein